MAKPFNEQLNKDVTILQQLRTKRDKSEYKKFFTVVSRRHKITRTTLWAEMRKDNPGEYRSINWQMRYRPITDEEVSMVYELLKRHYTLEAIKKIMEKKLGGNYSDPRMKKIRVEIDKKAILLDAENKTAFGGSVSEKFSELFNLDLMDPKRTHTTVIEGKEYKVTCSVIKDAMDLIRYSAEADGKNLPALQRIQMELMLSRKMESMMGCPQLPVQELRSAEIVRRSLGYANPDSFHPDYLVLIETVREFKPDVTYPEVFVVAQKYHEKIKNSTDYIVPPLAPLMKLAAREAMKNM